MNTSDFEEKPTIYTDPKTGLPENGIDDHDHYGDPDIPRSSGAYGYAGTIFQLKQDQKKFDNLLETYKDFKANDKRDQLTREDLYFIIDHYNVNFDNEIADLEKLEEENY